MHLRSSCPPKRRSVVRIDFVWDQLRLHVDLTIARYLERAPRILPRAVLADADRVRTGLESEPRLAERACPRLVARRSVVAEDRDFRVGDDLSAFVDGLDPKRGLPARPAIR